MAITTCPDCARPVSDRARRCVHCGRMLEPRTDAAPRSHADADGAPPRDPRMPVAAEHPWFPVSLRKFAVMSLVTFGAYPVYWCYWNWRRVERDTREVLNPVWRAFWAIIYCFPLFRRIRASAEREGIAVPWTPWVLALAYLGLSFTFRLPGVGWLLGLFAFVPFLPVVRTVAQLNAREPVLESDNHAFSLVNWITIGVMGLFLALAVYGSLLPDEALGIGAEELVTRP